MVGILLVTHGNFSTGLLNAAELILGKQKNVVALTLNEGDDVQLLSKEISEKITELDNGEGVLVLTDMFGGSPSNATAANMKSSEFQSLTGVNLPMLIEGLSLRDSCNLDELTESCYRAGIEGVKNIKSLIKI